MVVNKRGDKVDASPTKAFFVNMITRDITLEDTILDLIDNSIDAAWHNEGGQAMELADTVDLSAYRISIFASPERFSIRDNCGGMTLDDAVEHAFSFGRRGSQELEEYSIGVYGIGMKRAAFKLGTNIRVRSTYTDSDGAREAFAVPILVDEWMKNDNPPWDFDIDEDHELDDDGVEIVVESLKEGTKAEFGNPAFIRNLRRTIARDYSLHLNRGLKIAVGEKAVEGLPIELRQGGDFAPVRVEYKDQPGEDEVMVEIIGGMAAPPPESIDPDDAKDGVRRFGWYVACNGRIVLAADKTTVSGWGTSNWPQWHQQYSGFIGIVLFTAANAADLPLTTTKRSVDASLGVYLRARRRMRDISKEWIAYTNVRKQALSEAKRREAVPDAVPIQHVKKRLSIALPKLVRVKTAPVANVNYSVPVSKMKRLATELGNVNMTYRDVGLKSFDYTYDDHVGDG